jgi:hypothetical protein
VKKRGYQFIERRLRKNLSENCNEVKSSHYMNQKPEQRLESDKANESTDIRADI